MFIRSDINSCSNRIKIMFVNFKTQWLTRISQFKAFGSTVG